MPTQVENKQLYDLDINRVHMTYKDNPWMWTYGNNLEQIYWSTNNKTQLEGKKNVFDSSDSKYVKCHEMMLL